MRKFTHRFIVVIVLAWSGIGSAATPSMPIEVLFYDPVENNNFSSRGWYDNSTQILSNDGAVAGSTRSIDWTWSTNATSPPNGGAMRFEVSETDNVYLSFYFKLSSNWVGSATRTYHPHLFHFLTTKDSAFSGLQGGLSTELTLYAEQVNRLPRLVYANVSNPSNGNEVSHLGSTTISLNEWHRMEVFFKLNTYTGNVQNNDGVMKLWLDGNLEIDISNATMREGPGNADMLINQLILAPWLGDGSPVNQTYLVDELTVGIESSGATTRPNPPTSVVAD